jgi:hypothetical protein
MVCSKCQIPFFDGSSALDIQMGIIVVTITAAALVANIAVGHGAD